MKKVIISQPMTGKTIEEIMAVREKAVKELEGKGYKVLDTFFTDLNIGSDVVKGPLYFLAKSLEKMSLCHAVYFCNGWENTRGCKIEHSVAKEYGLEIIYEV